MLVRRPPPLPDASVAAALEVPAPAALPTAVQPTWRTYAAMFVARAFAMLGPFAVAVITARMLGPEDRGRYYYVLTLAAVGAQLASLGLQSSNTYILSRRPELLPQIMTNAAWIALLGGAAAAAGVVAFDFAAGEAAQRHVLAAIVLTSAPLTLLFLYLSNLAVAIDRPALFNGLVVFGSATSLALALAVAGFAPSLNAFLVAAVLASGVTCTVAWIALARGRQIPAALDLGLLSEGIAFALRAHIAVLLGFLMARTSIVLLRHQAAFEEVGYWSIAAQIVDALLLLPATVGMLLFPALVRATESERWSAFASVALRVSAVMAVICAVAAAIAHPAVVFVFGTAYAPAADIMIALLPGVFFLSVTSVVSQFLSAYGIPRMQIVGWGVGWLLQIAVSLMVVRPHGAIALAWVQSACAGVVCLWLMLMAFRYHTLVSAK